MVSYTQEPEEEAFCKQGPAVEVVSYTHEPVVEEAFCKQEPTVGGVFCRQEED